MEEKKPEEIKEPTVPIKAVAIEVLNHLNNLKIVSSVSMIGYFILVFSTAYNTIVGSIIALALVGFSGIYLYKSVSEIARIQKQYELNRPKQKV